MRPIQEILGKKLLIIDGAMGTLLMQAGVRPEEGFDLQNLTNPDKVQAVHQAYVDAGANIIETNTFGANRIKLADYNASDKAKEINIAAVKIAKLAAGDKAYVCGSIGPLGKLLHPYGAVNFDDAYEAFAEQAKALSAGGADILCIETISDLQEMRAAIIAAKQNTKLPIISSMTYDENQRTVYGTPPEVHSVVAQALGADVISANCSTGPEGMLEVAKKFIATTALPIMVMPNAGMPVLENGEAIYRMKPEEFAKYAQKFAKIGVSIIGGCCGTNPDHIKAISSLSLSIPIG
ncbi:MAG: homocysteine S-methyltransferase family protein, partial [Candidatus Margulisiibacteriota bacterium]